MRSALKGAAEVIEPILIRIRIIVDIRDDFATRELHPGIPRGAQTAVFGSYQPYPIILSDFGGIIGRPVIDDDNFVIGVIELAEVLKALAYGARSVITAYDH